ncbi:MAG: type I methionyl aminopeptidase [Candidatus Vogelbacteria bacterium RIFOXYD1_FULL_44_32]|uniref:Methionine aminopeptidase n=1 Tax=Candidatus Vogelbacteria bacterium RIFOXYD1_FULL_44_32 TaxID=1802438 RepID=A0A1G2QDV4_9BACT|nr:MAG: type I methionyl aminopeptidase [Candidatus Vogelbacteria bacterium RIFOXYD1_FULL_44_32]
MIRLKSDADIATLKIGGQRQAKILSQLAVMVKPGLTTVELDDYARELITKNGDTPAFLNYRPRGSRLAYPATLCVSINEEIVHGIPSKRVIKEGDLVTLDLGIVHEGMFTDSAITVGVGQIATEDQKLLNVTKEALRIGIEAALPGRTTGHIGQAIEKYVLGEGFGLVRDLSGHGVGFAVHEDPEVPNYGRAGEGEKLVPGLVIAIEPMVVVGSEDTKILADGFTFITADKKNSAHFEHTIVVTEKKPEILTELN